MMDTSYSCMYIKNQFSSVLLYTCERNKKKRSETFLSDKKHFFFFINFKIAHHRLINV